MQKILKLLLIHLKDDMKKLEERIKLAQKELEEKIDKSELKEH
jgi:predicted Holliday junction resolvase-like endonuclease